MKKFPFVEIIWLDAVSTVGWKDGNELPKPQPVVTRGWLIKKDRERLVISHSLIAWDDGEIDYGGVFTIPRGMIKRVRNLRAR